MINENCHGREDQIIALSGLYRGMHYFCKKQVSCKKVIRNFPFISRSDGFVMLRVGKFLCFSAQSEISHTHTFLIPNINCMCDFVFNFCFRNCRYRKKNCQINVDKRFTFRRVWIFDAFLFRNHITQEHL